MSFYTKLPLVVVSKLEGEKALQARFDHHKQLKFRPGPIRVDNAHMLLDGTLMDTVSHHCMKLIAATSTQFLDFFIESEVELFRRRVLCLTRDSARQYLERVVLEARMGRETYREKETVKELDLIVKTAIRMLERCAHAFASNHPRECEKFNLKMHFTECLQLVGKRAVELSRGVATVYCGLWGDVLKERFRTFLRLSVQDVADYALVEVARHDERIWPSLQYIKYQLILDVPRGSGTLTIRNLQEKSELFPPCMKNAYLLLKRRHRLVHEARRAFTLFLKDAGMNVQSAIAFWASEFSKEAHSSTSCKHNWQNHRRKLVYSIRHMYGLEGSRITYTSFSCNKIQSKEAEMWCEVMCPFTEGNIGDLEKTIPENVRQKHPTLLADLRASPPLSAKGRCHYYQRTCHGCDAEKTFESPVGYYRCSLAEAW